MIKNNLECCHELSHQYKTGQQYSKVSITCVFFLKIKQAEGQFKNAQKTKKIKTRPYNKKMKQIP